jgi:small GTP-binding protein
MNKISVLFTGSLGVGKTSIIKRMQQQTFNDKYIPTVGVQKSSSQLADQQFTFSDLAGELQQDKIPHSQFSGIDFLCYVFDISRTSSYENLNEDLQHLQQHANCPLLTLANKSDLVQAEISKRILLSLGLTDTILLSAKTGEGIDALEQRLLVI